VKAQLATQEKENVGNQLKNEQKRFSAEIDKETNPLEKEISKEFIDERTG
jgi:hypothetical protein